MTDLNQPYQEGSVYLAVVVQVFEYFHPILLLLLYLFKT